MRLLFHETLQGQNKMIQADVTASPTVARRPRFPPGRPPAAIATSTSTSTPSHAGPLSLVAGAARSGALLPFPAPPPNAASVQDVKVSEKRGRGGELLAALRADKPLDAVLRRSLLFLAVLAAPVRAQHGAPPLLAAETHPAATVYPVAAPLAAGKSGHTAQVGGGACRRGHQRQARDRRDSTQKEVDTCDPFLTRETAARVVFTRNKQCTNAL